MKTETSGFLQTAQTLKDVYQSNPLDTMQTGQLNQYVPSKPQGVCPSCGHCPHCGRGGYHTYPYYPYYQPYYQQPYIWCGGGGNVASSLGNNNLPTNGI